MGVVSTIFDTLSQIVVQIVSLMGSLFEGVADIFYTAGEAGAPGSLTFVGTLSLIGVGIGLFWLGFRFIRSLIKTRG